MRILFHVGVGNKDRPQRWSFVNKLFSNLARTFEKLGHECIVWYHPKASTPTVYKNSISSVTVSEKIGTAKSYSPDWVFTWNGASEGDQEIVKHFGKDIMIFGELGFFDHYKTCHFDFSGVNAMSANRFEPLIEEYDKTRFHQLVSKYKKPRAFKEDFVFVPLQDERDTNITKYSPVKRMEELLDYVENKYKGQDIKILYKKHPQYKVPIKFRANFIEVSGDVHSYVPYAKEVIGINSTVLFETLLYHKNITALGKGIMSRELKDDEERVRYIMHCYGKQFYWPELNNVNTIKNSFFYKKMIENEKG